MKILQIKVEKLFDSFTHTIDFKIDGGITLILGQNGLGKTVILNMIKSIFDGDFYKLIEVTFYKIIIKFDNNTSWEFEKVIDDKNNEDLLLKLLQNGDLQETCSFSYISEKSDQMLRGLKDYLPTYLRRTEENEWYDRRTSEKFTIREIIEKFRDYIPSNIYSNIWAFPEWFTDVKDDYKVNLIETQRLLTVIQTDERYARNHVEYRNTVEEYSKELISEINAKLANSSELSTKLDRTYPNRLIERLRELTSITQKELNIKLDSLEEKRTRLEKVGLLDLKKEPSLLSIKVKDKAIIEVLLVYIEDSNSKLEVYDELADKIELFLKLINERFLYKYLSINKDTGFIFKSSKSGLPIPLNKLSSGEQHLLVLFYQLLFKFNKNTFLLIDEPEISLHISWQKKFITDLKEIFSLNQMEVLIATHSPSIIGKNWELTNDLDAKLIWE